MVFEFWFEGEHFKLEAEEGQVGLFVEGKHSPREVKSGDARWTEHEKRGLSVGMPVLTSELVVQLVGRDSVSGLAEAERNAARLRHAVESQGREIMRLLGKSDARARELELARERIAKLEATPREHTAATVRGRPMFPREC